MSEHTFESLFGMTADEMVRREQERLAAMVLAGKETGCPPLMAIGAREAAQALRAIPSEARAQASRENGKKGGRPKKKK